MKISLLELKDFNQFKNLTIDLTYPKGHEKAGKPLDKVCFIGQSGTGKTTLLKLIYAMSYDIDKIKDFNIDNIADKVFATLNTGDFFLSKSIKLNNKTNSHNYIWQGWHSFVKLQNTPISQVEFDNLFNEHIKAIKTLLIFFPSNLKYVDFNNWSKYYFSLSPKEAYINQLDEDPGFTDGRKIYDFNGENIYDIWKIIYNELQTFQEKELILTQKISNIVSEENAHTNKLQKVVDELKNLRNSPSNPMVRIAEDCLDPLLKNFNLKVKRESDIKTKDDIGLVKIVDIHDNEIPNALLSTGTQQIILSALPLYLLKPEQTIILYDEPERSLYPDMQKLIIDYYSSFAKDSQFFYATHSPIIASCFEPWEIVELKFDKDGYVVQEQYFEGERHVDNYTINPKYLTYDLMLSKIFDVKEPLGDDRNMKITEMLTQKKQLEKMKSKNQTDTPEFKKLLDEYLDNGKKLFWDTNLA